MGKKRGRSDIGASCLLAQRLLKGESGNEGKRARDIHAGLSFSGSFPPGLQAAARDPSGHVTT